MRRVALALAALLALADATSAQPVQPLPDWRPPVSSAPAPAPAPLPLTPPMPKQLSVEEYTYLVTQNAHLLALLTQVRDALQREDQAHSAILTQLRELEARIGKQVREEGIGDLNKWLAGGAALSGAILSGTQLLRNAPRCQP